MLYPAIEEIRKKADSKYTLCVIAAKRARDIIDGRLQKQELEKKESYVDGSIPIFTEKENIRPVSIAAHEIFEDQITYKREEK